MHSLTPAAIHRSDPSSRVQVRRGAWHAVAALASLALTTLAGCGGGTIGLRINMPGPGGVTEKDGITTFTAGVIVDPKDGTDVCGRLRVYYYKPSSAPADPARIPDDVTPLTTGKGLGKYDPQQRQCLALAYAPPGDYWVAVEYPIGGLGGYFVARPSVTPIHVTGGKYPVHVVESKGTEATIDLVEHRDPVPGP